MKNCGRGTARHLLRAWKKKGWVRQGNPKGSWGKWDILLPLWTLWWEICSQKCFDAGVDDGDKTAIHWGPPELVCLLRAGIRTESILLLPSAAYSALQKFQKSSPLGSQRLHYSIFLLGWKGAIGKNWHLPLKNWWTTWTLLVFKWRHKNCCQISQQ